ncbi:precorrin-3B synthase [Streptoalloteichus tenebrarius]|uniref:Precorrin-3B synthase n=1 Tax=Streptoalloteichus tenebrarius (strain ATCC 17920 / DSM 40477 / JCM 4838 / CBS 697.72 / NBRC 16177 / NCIMB 11028 / NRRL B-12390 / A12253. 1 / ISP 5477) TaxID=1933 RepID=A0ABT1I169_STRSD|nr:precorrin-3B synthase [Streptoalloteichus tenebrarius]MCP2261514.1 precorrin-3B synthase [Streptoalloteichus tenebrarius]BFE99326.1 precorrin-3B synthase [Streptoalloteichus tenebrarius]
MSHVSPVKDLSPGSDPGPGRTRPDACPGALRAHQAADGGLARVRAPGGALSARQMRALAAAAAELGDGHLELTSRGNIQLRGLAPGAEPLLAARLAEAGLLPSTTHERVRNILASPLSGRDGQGAWDVRPLVTDLDQELRARPELAELSGRFLFTVDDGRGDVAGLDGDVGVLALDLGRAAVLLSGEDTGLRVSVEEAVDTMLAAASAFLAERAARGSRAWRIAELIAELEDGPARILTRLADRLGRAPEPGPALVVRPRQHGPVGSIRQRDGRVAMAVLVPLGRLSAQQADILADAALDGGDELRVTPWRGVVVPDLPGDGTGHWSSTMDSHGLVVDPASPWVGVSACAGRPGCGKAMADVRADATWVTRRADEGPGTGLPVHWVGCGRRCGRPRGRVVEVVATGAGYEVTRDGHVLARTGDIEETAAAVDAARRDQ